MAREVRHDARSPLKLDEDDIDEEKGDIAVCRCGLSAEYPFCDGTHRTTRDEEEGTVYRYEDGERRVIEEIVYREGNESGDHGNGTDDRGDGNRDYGDDNGD
ncbi:CDGSH iron-sulfur domain-containing protein [Haladaptatus sp. T7]|uniref:CDGSH iron-sulfur domain-containing protein n=1 Tax=Haladaptatus sp. T7 TaxID=2029368 RepID=UPI0021A250ED|nr:CDGSH iron-sulfur domain-containing protein [Haladaptatus sp. T7]GKZ15829.1 hypothetical protein HAL_37100 [Haladaptatus sp. T7]